MNKKTESKYVAKNIYKARRQSLLTSDGLLAVHESNSEEKMELSDEPSVSDLPDEDPDFAEDFDCETDNEERNNRADAKERNNRAESGSRYGANKRKREQPVPLEQQLERSEQAIKSLTKHLDRKTCPKSLQYRARARIRADNDFRRDIKRLRSKAEQEYVQALIRFHNRKIESLRSALRKEKRIKLASKTDKQSTVTKSTDFARSAPSKHLYNPEMYNR